MAQHMLTTVDNPHDPFTEFKAWFTYDVGHGYHSSVVLAQEVKMSDDLSSVDQSAEIERAIDFIVEQNVNGMFRKVSRESEEVS